MFISIHAPVKGATILKAPSLLNAIFQSTLPWRERHAFENVEDNENNISIHAPVKGATKDKKTGQLFPTFQSTLPWRERLVKAICISTSMNFNPRSREGSDMGQCIYYDTFGNFNPRSREGSDIFWKRLLLICMRFQSTLPWRERLFELEIFSTNSLFQSTLPWRERPFLRDFKGKTSYFNPRSREGSDRLKLIYFVNPTLFQSTLPWRERQNHDLVRVNVVEFQSTLPWRERPAPFDRHMLMAEISIHAPVKGATFVKCLHQLDIKYFNPRSREGSDVNTTSCTFFS